MDLIACFLLLIFSNLPFQSLAEAKIGGFSVEIFHRDSQLSPFYNPSATLEDLSSNAFFRSIARVDHFHQYSLDAKTIESPIIINSNDGDYLMTIYIGRPPVKVLAIADTGSDLVWVQCEPCSQCYPQDDPLFDPTKSSTYLELSCDSDACENVQHSCGPSNNKCQYSYSYADHSYTNGDLSTDTFTFDSTDGQDATFPNSVFGCGHNNSGIFGRRGSGLVGLSGGPLSLISQLGTQVEQKFSYCLLPSIVNSTSTLKFGTDAVLSGPEVVSTPLSIASNTSWYLLNLEGATVGDKKIVNSQMPVNGGNIMIDSGTTLTMLESCFYNDLEAAIKEMINLQTVDSPQGNYKLCYDQSSFSSVPEITVVFNFKGADVALKKLNLFIATSSDVVCLAMEPTSGGTSIFGNMAQVNFQVEYDLVNKQVSFAPADCTQY